MKNMDEIFSYSVACDIVNESEDPEPRSSLNIKIGMIGQNGKTLYRLN